MVDRDISFLKAEETIKLILMKSSITLILVLFTLSGLLAHTDCKVKVVCAMNKSLTPGYSFKTDPQPEGAKYSWSFGDNTYSDSSSPTHTYRITGTYTVMVKVTASDGKVCYGELKASFEGQSNPILSGRGKVKKLAVEGCDLVIALDNGTTLIPVRMNTDFQIKEGQYIELTYEKLATKITDCREGTEVNVLLIK